MANCLVSGTFTSPQGSAIASATVRFNTQTPLLDVSGNLIMPKEITTVTAADGTWSLSIAQGIAGNLTLDLNPTTISPVVRYNFSLVIPSSASSTFASCWVDSGTFGGQGTSSPLSFSSIAGQLGLSQLPSLADAQVWVGNSSSQATGVSISGDISLSDTGVAAVSLVGGSSASLVHSGEVLANAATSLNTPSTIVKRDGSGNFSAGVITASLLGNAVTATLATNATNAATSVNFSASLVGDVTGSQNSTTLSKIQGVVISGVTGTGNAVLDTSPTLTNPVVGTQAQTDSSTIAASTSYVTTAIANAVAGINPAVAVLASTTAASDTSSLTYNNGVSGVGATFTGAINTAFTVDGVTFTTTGQRVLIKNDTQSPSGAFNGVYSVTQVQTIAVPVVLTRSSDYNSPSDINNTGSIPVISGTVNGTTSWVQTAQITSVGTDALSFTKFTRNPADYLLKANNLSDVSSTSTSFATIAPAPSTSGNVLTSNGSTWVSQVPSSSPIVSAVALVTSFYSFS